MVRLCTIFLLLTVLSGCSGWDVSLSQERTSHFRTLATFTHHDDNPDDKAFAMDLRKRDQSVMMEKTFYKDGDLSASFTGGRHRQQRWMAGLSLNYSF